MNLAEQAANFDEVPVGALLVQDGMVIADGYNSPISGNDATAHAEINAIRNACTAVGNYRLPNATLYVTLEPCAMCAGAIIHSRISRVVCAAREPRAGAGGSVMNILQHPNLNHQCDLQFGLMAQQSSELLKQFFRAKRSKK